MWICPKCAREFGKTNQDHYCGKTPETIDEYIISQVPQAQQHLAALRAVICSCVPEVKERIAWSMPYFSKGKRDLSMAAFKKHVSLYVDGETIAFFLQQTTDFAVKKNAIYFPYEKGLPEEIIADTVKHYFQDHKEAGE